MGLRARRWLVDGAVTALVAVVVGLDLWWSVPGTRAADGVSYGLLGVTLVAVALRRHAPVVVMLACLAVQAAFTLLGHRGELLNLATLVGLFTVAVQGSRRRTVVVGGAVVVGSGLLGAYAGGWSSAPVPELLWPTVSLLLGEAVRGHRELRREHADREARAAAEQELLAADRIRQERLRVARDVHDVVAHTMTAVNVQMGVAVAAFDRDPTVAREALAQARRASRDALGELRSAVALLREPADRGRGSGADASPAPTLADIARLADQVRSAGIAVTVDDRTSTLPAAVAATAYRIVQEALTNVVKHSLASQVVVTVEASDAAVTIEVVDDGRGDSGAGEGFGRRGMAERAAAIGGWATSGPLPRGGFQVRARLPLGTGEGVL